MVSPTARRSARSVSAVCESRLPGQVTPPPLPDQQSDAEPPGLPGFPTWRGVYPAYESLARRFDGKTRLLGAALSLLQRGLAAGVTIYAPAIILSTVLGWRLDVTIVFAGLLVVIYTVTGGSEAVSLTQKWQMGIIFGGMITAFWILLARLPHGLGFGGAAHVAGAMGKLQA